jgi:hypothetical protein
MACGVLACAELREIDVGLKLADSMALQGRWLAADSSDDAPPARLVRAVAELLHWPLGRGHAVFRGSVSELGVARTRLFQVALLEAVWAEMIRRSWVPFGPDEVRLNQFEASDGRLPREIVGDVVTFKRLHFDPYSVVFAHLYEAPENLVGGTISLVDVRSYLRDTGCALAEAFEPLYAPGHNGRLVARDEHRSRMLQRYAHHVEPPGPDQLMLLLIRNDPSVGVAHEIAEVQVVDGTLPTMRRFFRASIAPHH